MILIAATNRPDILDPALLRPGRFDRQIVVDRPDLEGRGAILASTPTASRSRPSVDLDVIARRTPGFTGADLANLLNEAALLAARAARQGDRHAGARGGDRPGRRRPGAEARIISDEEKQVIAYHEAGHALVGPRAAERRPGPQGVDHARGRRSGYTLHAAHRGQVPGHPQRAARRARDAPRGRTAEEIVFGDPTTGACNDIERATRIARQMVSEFGMSDEPRADAAGPEARRGVPRQGLAHTPDYSEVVAAKDRQRGAADCSTTPTSRPGHPRLAPHRPRRPRRQLIATRRLERRRGGAHPRPGAEAALQGRRPRGGRRSGRVGAAAYQRKPVE